MLQSLSLSLIRNFEDSYKLVNLFPPELFVLTCTFLCFLTLLRFCWKLYAAMLLTVKILNFFPVFLPLQSCQKMAWYSADGMSALFLFIAYNFVCVIELNNKLYDAKKIQADSRKKSTKQTWYKDPTHTCEFLTSLSPPGLSPPPWALLKGELQLWLEHAWDNPMMPLIFPLIFTSWIISNAYVLELRWWCWLDSIQQCYFIFSQEWRSK
jgi:hypothetical protein